MLISQMVKAFAGDVSMYEVEKGGRIALMHGFVTGGFVDMVGVYTVLLCCLAQ